MAPGCEDEYPNGVTEIDGVPVVDVISAGVRLAEVLVSFKRAGLSWISRAADYRRPSAVEFENCNEDFPYSGSGSWHY
ncbi:MAG: hypothetical protein JW854_04305 [Actinobacteria bacterium]|nr:hypothetical protein [Actinomycetota bacterium]